MKKILLFSATIGIGSLALTSYSGGPAMSGAGNRTGAAGSTANCSTGGCHAASSTATTAFIEIAEAATPTVVVSSGKYTPGTAYIVTIRGISTPSRPKFGFQVGVTKSDNSNAGTLSAIPSSGTMVHAAGTINVVEHSMALNASPSAGSYSAKFNWTAPAKGAGTVTFYGIINAVDGTGSTSGDLPSNGSTGVFTEGTPASIAAASVNSTVKIFPNPCSNFLTVEGLSAKTFTARVADLAGRVIINAQSEGTIDVTALQNGIYVLTLTTDAGRQTSTFVKQ